MLVVRFQAATVSGRTSSLAASFVPESSSMGDEVHGLATGSNAIKGVALYISTEAPLAERTPSRVVGRRKEGAVRPIPENERTPANFAVRLLATDLDTLSPPDLDAVAWDFLVSLTMHHPEVQQSPLAITPELIPEARRQLRGLQDLYVRTLGKLADNETTDGSEFLPPKGVGLRLDDFGNVQWSFALRDHMEAWGRDALWMFIQEQPFGFARCGRCERIFYRGADRRRSYCPEGCARLRALEERREEKKQYMADVRAGRRKVGGTKAAKKTPQKGGTVAQVQARKR
jgi:hypothetical protein